MSDDFEKLSMKDLMTVDDRDVEQTHNTELNQPESVLPDAVVDDDDDDDDDDDVVTIENSASILPPSSSGELLGVYLEVITRQFSYRPLYQARVSISAPRRSRGLISTEGLI